MGSQHSQHAQNSGSRGGGPSMSNLPPLLFNAIHGENINITDNGTVARRVSSFCKAIVFSDRPVKIHEKVCLKFLEVSTNWSGVLRFGFTNNDPSTLRSSLPRYACPDLTAKSGFWAKAFSDVHVKKDAILYYYVNQAGDVHFGINGEDKGVFFSGVDTRGFLWALIDIYGNTTALEFVDIRAHLNNSRRSITDTNSSVANDVNTTLVPSVNAMNIGGSSSFMEKFPEIHYYPSTVRGSLLFHRTKGQHAEIGVYRCMAWRRTNEYSNGYVFTATPIQPGEGVVIQVLQSDLEFASSMAFGLTACDPDTIQSVVLPDDSHFLLDRPEYWVVKKDAANSPAAGDELCFTVTHSGEVLMSKNGHAATTLMHVDNSIPLWAFFDLYGTTTKIFLLGKVPAPAPPRPAETRMVPQRTNLIASSSSVTSVPHSVLEPTPANYLPAGLRPIPRSQSSTLPGGALSNLSTFTSNPSYESSFHSPTPSAPAPSMDRLVPNGNFNTNASPAGNAGAREVQGVASPPYSTPSRELHNNWSVECVICCERPVDSVFYSCGHMCMCYQCATDYWKTKDKGWCPICRATITDVIRTYKS
ncbi:unnamed protein product [Allacma fusca]|uniref:Protein neuralized n=1 Tax=Allacma fusca TaxID=39272 RepID=A0A8J2PCE8_9HEXA|nr:unnamed protein product [Allacma fusca]